MLGFGCPTTNGTPWDKWDRCPTGMGHIISQLLDEAGGSPPSIPHARSGPRPMTGPRVLLLQLSERTSAKGNRYLAGWLGKASVVAFQAEEPDKFGNPVWDVFVSTPEPRPEAGQERDPARRPQARRPEAEQEREP